MPQRFLCNQAGFLILNVILLEQKLDATKAMQTHSRVSDSEHDSVCTENGCVRFFWLIKAKFQKLDA